MITFTETDILFSVPETNQFALFSDTWSSFGQKSDNQIYLINVSQK